MAYRPLTSEDVIQPDPLSPLSLPHADRHLPKPSASTAEKKLVGALREIIDHAVADKKPRERTWEYNRLLLRGEQHIAQDFTTGDVVRMVQDESADMLSVDNQLLPIARAYVGKFIRLIPSCMVLPRSEDRADLRSAEVIDSYLDYQWRNLRMKLLYKRAMEMLPWAGTAIFEAYWDHNKGRKLVYCPTCQFTSDMEKPGQPCPVCVVTKMPPEALSMGSDPTQFGVAPLQKIREGDVALTLHDPRSFFPEPGVAEIKDMQKVFTRTPLPVAVLRRRYPDKAGLIMAEDGINSDRALVYSIGPSLSTRYDTTQLKGHAYHHCIHIAPGGLEETEKGLIVYMVNDRIMEIHENPYYEMFDQFAFEAMYSDREPNVFWGIPPLDNAAPLQKERNTLATQTREHRELTNNPKVLVPDGCRLDIDRWTTVPGEIIKFKANAGGKPSYLTPPALAQYVYAEFARMSTAMREKFGVTDNEMGNSPTDQSGRHSAFVEAQSNEAIAPIVLENMEAWMQVHFFVAMIGLTYTAPDKRWVIRGHDMPRSYYFGLARDLRPGWNLVLADEDSLSKNPALRLQQSLALLGQGVYTDPTTGVPDMKEFKQHAMLRTPGRAPDSDGRNRAYAAMIPERIRQGEQFMPKPWDDAQICAEELLDWLQTDAQTAEEPLVRQVFQIWMVYANALAATGMVGPATARLMPNQGLMQGMQQGQGSVGNPNSPATGMGPGDVNSEAQGLIQQADNAAESVARPVMGAKEGSTV